MMKHLNTSQILFARVVVLPKTAQVIENACTRQYQYLIGATTGYRRQATRIEGIQMQIHKEQPTISDEK
jgi:hypothetical protein